MTNILVESYFNEYLKKNSKQYVLQEGVMASMQAKVQKFQQLAIKALKTKDENMLKLVDKIGETAAKKVSGKTKQIEQTLKNAVMEKATPQQLEESNIVFKGLKSMMAALSLPLMAISFLNPFRWYLILVLINTSADKNISIFEAWERLFKFRFQSIRYKWSSEYLTLFWATFISGAFFVWFSSITFFTLATTGSAPILGVGMVLLFSIVVIWLGVLGIKYALEHKSASGDKYTDN